ncbi:MAG: hypothetical protein ACK505_12405 [Flavobacteriales bacterium]|jgi:hypothetical protein
MSCEADIIVIFQDQPPPVVVEFDTGMLPSDGAGESNTGSNVGTEGVGIYDGKVGAVLNFRNVKANSGRLSIQFNVGTKTIEFDLGTLAISDVQSLQSALDGKQPSGSYANVVHTHSVGDVTGLASAIAGKMDSSVYDPNGNGTVNDSERLGGQVALDYALKSYVDNAINNLVNGSPALLDTLLELSNALGNDPNFATTVANALAGKEPTINGGTASQYWSGNKTWQALNLDAVAETANRKHVSQAEKDSWNAKADPTHTHFINEVSGLQNALDAKASIQQSISHAIVFG